MYNTFTGKAAGRKFYTDNRQNFKCKTSCCYKCSYCTRAFTKERNKSRGSSLLSERLYIKICEKCFLCHSIVLCSTCNKCQKCCLKSTCRGQTSKLLANLAGSGGRSENSSNLERGLHPSFSDPAKTYKVSDCRKPLCQSPQEQLPVAGITSAYRQKCNRTGPQPNISGVFQLTFSSPKTQQQMEANTGPKQTKPFPQGGEIQNGDTRNHQKIPPTRGVGHLSRLQGCLLPHTNTGTIQKIPKISCPGPDLPIQGIALWPVHSAHGVHCFSKGGELMAIRKGIRIHQYLDDWLVRARSQETCLQHTQTLIKMCQDLGWLVNLEKSELEPKQVFDFVGYQFDLGSGRVRPTPDRWQNLQDKIQVLLSLPTCPVRQFMSLIGLLTATEKSGSPRPTTHETHTVASQKQLEGTRISREDYPSTKVPAPSLTMVARGRQCASRSTITPNKTCSANIYRRIKRRVGRSLKRVHCKRVLVGAGKQATHKLSGTKSSVPSLKRVSKSLCRQNSPGSNRQYYSSSLHKQGRRNEVGPTVCPTVENLDLVFPATSDSKSPTHPRPFKCDRRQAIQAGSNNPNRVVPPSGSVSANMQPMAPPSNRSVCHEVQPQITSVCLSSTGLPGCSSGCTYSAMGGPGCIRLPTDRHIGQSGGEATGLPVQETHSDCPGVAQHALVFGLREHVQPGPAQPAQSANTALQSDPSQKSDKSKSPCLAPRATQIKEQGFSEAVAARIEAPQRRSTRSVYEAKWTIFTKWCFTNQVDFRSPPVKSAADFLLHLFEDKKLQPSTIDGYRSAIADKLGDTTVNISKDDNLTRLLESFHRDRPKGRRGIPSWNLSLVLHQLTKAPFEPLREASLKHLTFKTVFLLALGSGKRRSEIHAWQHKNIRHQSGWSKVSVSISKLSLQEPGGQGGSGECSPSGHTSPGSYSG